MFSKVAKGSGLPQVPAWFFAVRTSTNFTERHCPQRRPHSQPPPNSRGCAKSLAKRPNWRCYGLGFSFLFNARQTSTLVLGSHSGKFCYKKIKVWKALIEKTSGLWSNGRNTSNCSWSCRRELKNHHSFIKTQLFSKQPKYAPAWKV